MSSHWAWMGVVGIVGLVGCDMSYMAKPKPTAPPAEPSPVVEAQPPQPAGVPEKAGVGVGIRGDSLRSEEGIGKMIASPAVTYFNIREKAVFEIQIPHALNLFKALEGRVPKTHEEFIEKIVKANSISLPELKPGMKYRYRPELGDIGELWVEPME